ncbi:unnamed protein product [Pleuronectes platessa]|uniref:Uncharacterized protein n=1 Tax=Pleuronectes platessa TaxID=8262 RepID=A0A9N7UZN8_PLEPL|nr:unnamed protein product [Pleuronectes platessa]
MKCKPDQTEQPISNQTDPTTDDLQWKLKSDIFKGYGWKEPCVFKIKPERKMKCKPAQTEQPISNQTDPTTDDLQWKLKSDIFKGYGWKEPCVFKIKPERKMKCKPIETEPVAAAASREEQPQVEVDVDASSMLQNTEEETQPRSIFSTMAAWRALWQTVRQAFVSLKMVLTRSWRRMGQCWKTS